MVASSFKVCVWEGFDSFMRRSKALIKAGKLGCKDCWGYFSCLHDFGVTAGTALNAKNVFLAATCSNSGKQKPSVLVGRMSGNGLENGDLA